jgi:type IX secretion system PorP/SprF family membrane protein
MKKSIVRKINKGLSILFLGISLSLTMNAQDIHFSQFYFSPLSVNPANTGNFSGNYRLSTNYKNQWKSISNPYKTAFASIDFSLAKKKLGLGLSFFNDKAGKSAIALTLANLSIAYNLKVNDENNVFAGLQYGFGQRSIKANDLKWDSQYNGTSYDPTMASGENQFSQSYTYMDASAGMLWNYAAKLSAFKSTTGVAVFHVNQSKKSFYGNEDMLKMKIVLHNNMQFKLPDKLIYIQPQFLFLKQGKQSEFDFGSIVRYVIKFNSNLFRDNNRIDIGAKKENKAESKNSIAIFAGGQLRYKDAFIAMFGFELRKSLLLSFSYDVNVSKLRTASNSRGGMELALTYKGSF